MSFNAVHLPYQVPQEYVTPYAHLQEPRRTYAGMLAAMDEGIGQIINAIDAKGLNKNTIIFFQAITVDLIPVKSPITDSCELENRLYTKAVCGLRRVSRGIAK